MLHFDRETGRVSLGYKQKSSDPWAHRGRALPGRARKRAGAGGEPHQLRRLRRARARRRGARRTCPRCRGRGGCGIPRSSSTWATWSTCMVLDVNKAAKRISLGMKQVEADPWATIDGALQAGRCACRARCATSPTSAPSSSWSPAWTACSTSRTCRGPATSGTRRSCSRRASRSRPRSSTWTATTSGSRWGSSRSSPTRGSRSPSAIRWARASPARWCASPTSAPSSSSSPAWTGCSTSRRCRTVPSPRRPTWSTWATSSRLLVIRVRSQRAAHRAVSSRSCAAAVMLEEPAQSGWRRAAGAPRDGSGAQDDDFDDEE